MGFAVSNSMACVESLVYQDETGGPLPRLATAWEISPNGKAVTFTLRKGVRFHDGTDFNAEALKFNFDRIIAENDSIIQPVTSVDVIDTYTARLNLSQFSNALFNALAFGAIVSPWGIQKNGKDWARVNPVGTGPFKFVEFKPSVSIKWAKADNYWDKGKPYLDAIEYEIVADRTVASMAYQKGQVHILTQTSEQIASDLKAKGLNVVSRPQNINYFACDSANSDSPFYNKKVREALEYAIDKQKLVGAVGYGFLQTTSQLCTPQTTGYNPDVKGRPYDPARAKQLLAEAGYPTGFKTKLMAQNSANQEIVVALQTFLKEVGIDAAVDLFDASRWTDTRYKGWKNGIMLTGSGTDLNMNQRLVADLATTATAYPCVARPAQWQAVLDQSVAARDSETRKAKIQQLMKMVSDEAFLTPIWIGYALAAMQKNVNCDFLLRHHIEWRPGDAWLGQ